MWQVSDNLHDGVAKLYDADVTRDIEYRNRCEPHGPRHPDKAMIAVSDGAINRQQYLTCQFAWCAV